MKEFYWLSIIVLLACAILAQYKIISAMPHKFTHAKAYYAYILNQSISFFFSLIYLVSIVNFVDISVS